MAGLEIEFHLPERAFPILLNIRDKNPDFFFSNSLRDHPNFEFRLKETDPSTLLSRRQALLSYLFKQLSDRGLAKDFFFESRHLNISFHNGNSNLFYDEHPDFATVGKGIAEAIAKAFYDIQPAANKASYLFNNYHDQLKYGYSASINIGTGKAAAIAHRDSWNHNSARLEIRTPVNYGQDGVAENFELVMLAVLAGALYAVQTSDEEKETDKVARANIGYRIDAEIMRVCMSWPLLKLFDSWGAGKNETLYWEQSMFSPKRLMKFGSKLKIDEFKKNQNLLHDAELVKEYRKALGTIFNGARANKLTHDISAFASSENPYTQKLAAALNKHVRFGVDYDHQHYYLFDNYPVAAGHDLPDYGTFVDESIKRMAESPVFRRVLTDSRLMTDAAEELKIKFFNNNPESFRPKASGESRKCDCQLS